MTDHTAADPEPQAAEGGDVVVQSPAPAAGNNAASDGDIRVAPLQTQLVDLPYVEASAVEAARQKPPVERRKHKLVQHDFQDVVQRTASPGTEIQQHFEQESVEQAPSRRILDGFLLLKVGKVEFPEEVTRIVVPNRNLGSTATEDLPYFTNLKYLDASDNYLQLEDLGHIPPLYELRLRFNQLSSLGDCSLLKNLEILDLSYNNLTQDAILALASIPRLRVLDLSGNGFKTVPRDMRRLRKVQELNLSSNYLHEQDIVRRLANMPRLRELDLENNMIKAFPDCSPEDFMLLEWVNLGRNGIETEYDIGGLISLKRLNHVILFGNPITDQDGDPFHESVTVGDRTIRITCEFPEEDASESLRGMYEQTKKTGKFREPKQSAKDWREKGNADKFGARAGNATAADETVESTSTASNNNRTDFGNMTEDAEWVSQYQDRAVLHPPSGIVELSAGKLHSAVVELREMLANPVNYDPQFFLRHNFARHSKASKRKVKQKIPYSPQFEKPTRRTRFDAHAEQQKLSRIENMLDDMAIDFDGDESETGSHGEMFATEIGGSVDGNFSFSQTTQQITETFDPARHN